MTETFFCEKLNACANKELASQVLEEVISHGVVDFCLCPGGRNAPLIYPLVKADGIRIYYWPEERSAAFFALGRIKATGRPAAVVTTSGTAAAELLPAAMEAYYSGLPLVLITADRPRRFRGSGAPQSAQQEGLYGIYTEGTLDLAAGDGCCLKHWRRRGPIHLNVCFEEPQDADCQTILLKPILFNDPLPDLKFCPDEKHEKFPLFLQQTRFPFVVVGELPIQAVEHAVRFLLHLNAPIYAEGISGLRENLELEHLLIRCVDDIWNSSNISGYPIDGVLRIGGVPTARLWRDLEDKGGEIAVFSLSERPFSGLSHSDVLCADLSLFFDWASSLPIARTYPFEEWKKKDGKSFQALIELFGEEPLAEPSLIHALSLQISEGSKVYLGNSLPIREWDMGATVEARNFQMACSRGVNGIDGQLAAFLGFSSPRQDNWSILGDLTLLYDLAAPWVSAQLAQMSLNVVVVNNGGAGIFKRMFAHPAFQNAHRLTFGPLAEFWGWEYEKWEKVPEGKICGAGRRLIELVPDSLSTERFWKKLRECT